MKTKTLLSLFIILLIFISGSAGSLIDDREFFNLNLYSTTVQTTTLKSGKSEVKECNSYFFITKSGIYDADMYGLFYLKFIEYPTFKYTRAVNGEIIYETVVANTFDIHSNKECLFTLNKNINGETYIITLRYDTYLFKFDCKSID
jgi:hypothetical protein